MYLVLKVAHVGAMVMFLGNISLAMAWKRDADRTRDPAIIAHVMRGVVAGDRWITVPSAVVLFSSGLAMAIIGVFPLLQTGWIWKALLAFGLSGALYAYPIGPDQRRMAHLALAAAGDPEAMDWAAYGRLSRRWWWMGVLAVSAVATAMALMILKPG